jgi:hypothetical protein
MGNARQRGACKWGRSPKETDLYYNGCRQKCHPPQSVAREEFSDDDAAAIAALGTLQGFSD